MNYYMGVDIGTSGCKVVVFDENGKQVSLGYREYDIISPSPGWAELDSNEVMARCFEVISEAAKTLEGGTVRGIGISSQGEAFTPIDSEGNYLTNALVSFDTRATKTVEEFSDSFGADRLYEITGHSPNAIYSIFKILWLRENRPDIWAKTAKFLCFEDLLHHRLGLDPAIGYPLAARTMLFDPRKEKWAPELLAAAGLTAENLARPLPSGSVVGTIPLDIANQLGLSEDTFVVTGGHDQPCGALGAGITRAGMGIYATGTVECITPAFADAVFSTELQAGNIAMYNHVIPGMYTTVIFCITGGSILKWFRDKFGAPEIAEATRTNRNAYELLLETAGNKPSGLLVLPYFSPSSGTPYFDTQTPGAIVGLRLTTTRGEIIRGLLEGVALEMRLNLDILEHAGGAVNELRAVGGGAKSRSWTQLKADVMGKPIAVMDVTEAASLGVAMLAAAADTGRNLVELVDEWVTPLEIITPRKKQSEFYNKQFETYKKLYPAIKGIGKA